MQNNVSNGIFLTSKKLIFLIKPVVIIMNLLVVLFTLLAFSSDIIINNSEYNFVWEVADIVSTNKGSKTV